MSLKNAKLKNLFGGLPRLPFEPIDPEVEEMPELNRRLTPGHDHNYLQWVNGSPVPWLCWCQWRLYWVLKELVKQGVSVEHFHPRKRIIPRKKCQEIAHALEKIIDRADLWDREMLAMNIRFFRHCGGIRVHNWKPYYDIK